MPTPSVIALGFFDGVHIGHGALLRRTAERARELGVAPAVFTFDRPPKEVVTGVPVPLINSARERQDIIRRLYGIENVILAPFDRQMMTLSWENFITDVLVGQYGAVAVVAGHDYHFGHKNQGDPEKLQQKCAQLGIGCDIIPKVELNGTLVSSTLIRTLLQQGDVAQAAAFLGHPHTMRQTVQHGKRLGRTIGIPTINLAVPDHVLTPRRGVYISRVCLEGGKSYYGVTNVGIRPTVSDNGLVSVETFLLGFDGDLYGQTVRLEFFQRLRDERPFASLEELKEQIHRDIDAAYEYFRRRSINLQ